MKTVSLIGTTHLLCGTCGTKLEASTGEGERYDKGANAWVGPVPFALVWPCPTCVGHVPDANRLNYLVVAMGRAGLAPLGASAAELRDVPSLADEAGSPDEPPLS